MMCTYYNQYIALQHSILFEFCLFSVDVFPDKSVIWIRYLASIVEAGNENMRPANKKAGVQQYQH